MKRKKLKMWITKLWPRWKANTVHDQFVLSRLDIAADKIRSEKKGAARLPFGITIHVMNGSGN